jgi:2-C-methyl-D-erythritol 4-phosphate cytidylyltransferase
MTETKKKLQYEVVNSTVTLPVIIVAAGSSNRMQGINKQFLEIGGLPVIVRTMLKFEKSDAISRIILVTRAEDIFALQMLGTKHNITKLTDIVCGGSSRQESVLNGFARLSADEEAVLIHDGARPFVSDGIISAVAEGLNEHFAVTCGVKVKDTIKQVDENGKVIKTLDRDSLFSVQTPQGVKKQEYFDSVEKAGDVSVFTDDMSVMEYGGYEVYTVAGSYKNIKITTPEDILVAESFLEEDI